MNGFDPKDPRTRSGARIRSDFTISIPIGYTVTYTHEYQPIGLCRHLSISVPDGKYPNPAAIQEIMKIFGFTKPLSQSEAVWEEKYAQGLIAINVMQKI